MSESVSFEREYTAPPDRVWAAWTEFDLLTKWFGCGPGMLWNVHEWDVRVGGAIHVSLRFDTGPFEVKGEFLAVEPPRHLRYRWQADQIVDVRMESHGSGTRLRLVHSGLSEEECRFVDAGWGTALTQLGQL